MGGVRSRKRGERMMGTLSQTTGLAFVLALLSAPAGAAEITCASQSAGYSYCRADTSKGVTLVEQKGPFACNKGNTWDFDKGGVWVSNGCAARFLLGPPPKNEDTQSEAKASGAENLARDLTSGAGPARKRADPAQRAPAAGNTTAAIATAVPPAQTSIVVCESKQYKLKKCPVPVTSHVQLRKKLGNAECRFNATWGYDYGEIWVTNGCRAEFSVY
jgi:hypothetical protein